MQRTWFVSPQFIAGQIVSNERAMALLWNFHPYGQRTRSGHPERSSPFGALNGFVYPDNWLHHLLIAGSMNGYIPRG